MGGRSEQRRLLTRRYLRFLKGKQNRPVLQKAGDPLPGKAYISTTTLFVPGTPDGVQRHRVDAVKINYIVLSPASRHQYGVAPGVIAVVYRLKTGKIGFAVFADGGDLGEASVKLYRDLGNEPVVISGGVACARRGIGDEVLTLVFPGINVPGSEDTEAWNVDIQKTGRAAFEKWGGEARIKGCDK